MTLSKDALYIIITNKQYLASHKENNINTPYKDLLVMSKYVLCQITAYYAFSITL